jgi:hypothetical protein
MDAPHDSENDAAEGAEPAYWPSLFGPSRAVLPFVLGAAPFVAIVAFVASYHSGREPLEALAFAAATLVSSLIATEIVAAFGATVFALFHPTYPIWKKILLFFAWRLPLLAIAVVWYWVGFKREWIGTFSLELPPIDGAYGALVTLSDLTAGFAVIPLGIGVYHRRWLHEHYCKADPRTLALLRIVLGFLLAADGIRHWKEASLFYANTGVVTNHFLLFKPFSGHNFTLWNAFSSPAEVHVIFALATLCYLLYMVGYRTRLFAILSLVMVTSQDNRLVLVENGGYVVVNLLTAWTVFMPTGKRFSVDALLRSYREHREKSWGALNDRFRPADKFEEHVSAIYLVALVDIAIVYFFNVVNKSGNIWRTGLTVHYVLHLDRMVTGLGVFFREFMPVWLSRVMTWSVLAVEALICAWILSPVGRRYTRPLAMVFMHALHGAFGLVFRLGPFSWFVIGWSYLLPRPENWADLETWYRKKARPATVVLDRTSPLAFAIGRLLARLDGLDLLTFRPSAEGEASPPLLAVETADGRTLTGGDAWRAAASALPGGRHFRVLLLIATCGLLGPFLRLLESRRAGIARFFGLGLAATGEPVVAATSAFFSRLASWRVTTRETFIAYLAVCAFFQVMIENKCFPPQLKPKAPPYLAATVGYPRMFQGWGMFAANPITDDGSLSVDAITVDGRHIDPFTGEPPDLNLSDARGLGLNQIWQDYFNRIRLDRNKVYRDGLRDYLTKWHLATGNPEDELVAFDVYWLRDQCPRPGETQPFSHEKLAILTYRKPGYRPRPGLPALPPSPKIVSAEGKTPESISEGRDQKGDTKGDARGDSRGNEREETPPTEKRGSGDVGKGDAGK